MAISNGGPDFRPNLPADPEIPPSSSKSTKPEKSTVIRKAEGSPATGHQITRTVINKLPKDEPIEEKSIHFNAKPAVDEISVDYHDLSSTSVSAHVDVSKQQSLDDHKKEVAFLKSLGTTDHDISRLASEGRLREWADLNMAQHTPYEKILSFLGAQNPDYDKQAVRNAVMVAMTTLKQTGKAQSINLSGMHTIIYKEKADHPIEFLPWSGRLELHENDEALGKGQFGIVRKLVNPDTKKAKALKTPSPQTLKRANQEIANESAIVNRIQAAYAAKNNGAALKGMQHALIPIQVVHDGKLINVNLSVVYKGDISDLYDYDTPLNLFAESFGEVAEALTFLHEEGIVHGDIKDGNIFYDSQGFRLADFGGVVPYQEWTPETFATGTFNYMPSKDIEDAVNQFQLGNMEAAFDIKKKMDVFALGVTMYTFLTQIPATECPDDEGGTIEGLFDLDHANPDNNFKQCCDVSHLTETGELGFAEIEEAHGPEVAGFIRRMIDLDRDKRPSAAECREFLSNLAHSSV